MKEILRKIIQWTFENEMIPEIYFSAELGGFYLVLKLRRYGKCIAHRFYIGGVISPNNWDITGTIDEEIECFIADAKQELLKENDDAEHRADT